MPASLRLTGWILAANAAAFTAMLLLGAPAAGAAERFMLWCGLG